MTASRPSPEDLAAEIARLMPTGVTPRALRHCTAILALEITQDRAASESELDTAAAAYALLSQAVASIDGESNGVAAALLGLATGSRGALLKRRRSLAADRLKISVDHFRREREEPLLEQVADELYAVDSAYRLRQRHRNDPARPSRHSRLGIDWLDRHQAYRRLWMPIFALRNDIEVLLRFVREEATPDQLAERAMNLNWRFAQFSRQLERFVEDYGGYWLLSDVDAEVQAGDAIRLISFYVPLGEGDISWLRAALADAKHGEFDPFVDVLLERREEAQILIDAWVEWARSCGCHLDKPDSANCEVHLWMSSAQSFIDLIDADWYRIADYYRASDANIRGEDIDQLSDAPVELGFTEHERAQKAIQDARTARIPPEQVLLKEGAIASDRLAHAIAERYGLDYLDLAVFKVDMRAANLLTATAAKRYSAVPVAFVDEHTLLLAISDPANVLAVDDIALLTRMEVKPAVASSEDIGTLIGRLDRFEETVQEAVDEGEETGAALEVVDLRESADNAPVIKLVHSIIAQAAERGASDIHFEPQVDERGRPGGDLRVRMRIDGVLSEEMTVPARMVAGVVSRIKTMADLDIAEQRIPQERRVGLTIDGRHIDLCVATIPSERGEGVVMRILDKEGMQRDLDKLGFQAHELDRSRTSFDQPHRAVLRTIATTAIPEAKRLAAELERTLGDEPLKPEELASRLVGLDAPVDLISAFDDALSYAAAADEPAELDESLWGPDPTGEQLLASKQTAHEALMAAREQVLDGALTREQAAQRLGISPQAVSKRLAAGGLVALNRGRERRFPAWQFLDEGLLPGLAEVIAAWPGTMLALSTWATAPSADLDGANPAEVLAQRDGVARVLAAEEALSSAAW